jgi:UDP-glucose 4-epimerase
VSIDSNGNPEIVTKNNILPTWNLLKHFSKQGIKKFIYLSTIHIYGNELNGVITENSPVLPASPYGLTHLISEEVINMIAREGDFECYNIRFSNGFGAPQFIKNNCWGIVINNLCLSVWETQRLVLKSDGTPIRDFMNITDLLIGIKQILSNSKNKRNSKTINFSSNNSISMLEAAFIIKNVYENKYNKEANIFINENQPVLSFKTSKSKKYLIDNSIFLDLMGENVLHDLEYGINEIFNFLDNSEKR